ncbi:hypothetical protein ACHQM5_024196 [Ranunculus cassubicifolius]
MSVYSWPESIISETIGVVRNFLCSGDPSESKKIIVAWKKITKPINEGELGIRDLAEINTTLQMKLAASILWGEDTFSRFMKAKFWIDKGTPIRYHKPSSIWPGIKRVLKTVKTRT